MTHRFTALTLCVALLLLGVPRPGTASGRTAPQSKGDGHLNWDAVARLKNGARVSVTTDRERDIEGTLKTAVPDVLVMVDAQGRERTIRREEIRQVQLGPQHGAGRYAGFGLLLGAAVGAAVGSANRGESELSGAAPVFGAMFGAFIGGPVGYAVGSGMNSRPWAVIYERPTAATPTVTFFPVLKSHQRSLSLTIAF